MRLFRRGDHRLDARPARRGLGNPSAPRARTPQRRLDGGGRDCPSVRCVAQVEVQRALRRDADRRSSHRVARAGDLHERVGAFDLGGGALLQGSDRSRARRARRRRPRARPPAGACGGRGSQATTVCVRSRSRSAAPTSSVYGSASDGPVVEIHVMSPTSSCRRSIRTRTGTGWSRALRMRSSCSSARGSKRRSGSSTDGSRRRRCGSSGAVSRPGRFTPVTPWSVR